MNRYDFDYVLDMDDNMHCFTVFSENYSSAYSRVCELININEDNFRVDVYKNVQLPIVITDYNCIKDDSSFTVDKLQNSNHKALMAMERGRND